MRSTPAALVVIMGLLHASCYAIGPDTSSWTDLETRIGNHLFRMTVPGKASIKPYFNIDDPALHASNAGALMLDRYWTYRGFRKEYGGLRCRVDIRPFVSGEEHDLNSYDGLSEAVERARRFSHEQSEIRSAQRTGGKAKKVPFKPGTDRRRFSANNTLWAAYTVSYKISPNRRVTNRYYTTALDTSRYLRVAIDTHENLKYEKKRDKWLPKAEALARDIAASLQVTPLPDKGSNVVPGGSASPPSASARPAQEPAVRTPKGRRGMHGTLSGNRYTFPGGLFDCTVPPYSGERGMSDFVHENGGNVTFWNQFNLERTDCVRFEPEDHEMLRTSGIGEKLYKSFFDEAMLPAVYVGMPDAELQFTGMVPIGDKNIGIEHLFLAYMRLPHQGNATRWEDGKEVNRDAYRAWLIYAADGYFFSVSSQVQTDLDKDRWIQVMTSAFQRYSFGRWWERE